MKQLQKNSRLSLHLECARVLEGINYFEKRIKDARLSMVTCGNLFPSLTKDYLNRIDTFERCIARLEQRYSKIKNQL